MSQERTRFPIQPQERHRSALSSRDVKRVPDESPRPDDAPQDKPRVPPQDRDRRGPSADDEDRPDDPAAGTDEGAGAGGDGAEDRSDQP